MYKTKPDITRLNADVIKLPENITSQITNILSYIIDKILNTLFFLPKLIIKLIDKEASININENLPSKKVLLDNN